MNARTNLGAFPDCLCAQHKKRVGIAPGIVILKCDHSSRSVIRSNHVKSSKSPNLSYGRTRVAFAASVWVRSLGVESVSSHYVDDL